MLVSHQANEQLILGHIINIHSTRNTHFIGSILSILEITHILMKVENITKHSVENLEVQNIQMPFKQNINQVRFMINIICFDLNILRAELVITIGC